MPPMLTANAWVAPASRIEPAASIFTDLLLMSWLSLSVCLASGKHRLQICETLRRGSHLSVKGFQRAGTAVASREVLEDAATHCCNSRARVNRRPGLSLQCDTA